MWLKLFTAHHLPLCPVSMYGEKDVVLANTEIPLKLFFNWYEYNAEATWFVFRRSNWGRSILCLFSGSLKKTTVPNVLLELELMEAWAICLKNYMQPKYIPAVKTMAVFVICNSTTGLQRRNCLKTLLTTERKHSVYVYTQQSSSLWYLTAFKIQEEVITVIKVLEEKEKYFIANFKKYI